MYRILLTIIFLQVFCQLKAQDSLYQGQVLSLKDCIQMAIKNNPDVRQRQYLTSSSKIALDQAKNNVLPSLNASIYHTLYNGRSINSYTNSYINQSYTSGSYDITTSFTLWNGSSIQNYIKKCALDYKATELESQQAIDQLTFNIILNYLSLLTAKEQLEIAVSQAEATAENVKLLSVKYAEGVVGMGDVSDIKGQFANNELTIIGKKNAMESARLALAQSLNIPYDSAMQIEPFMAIDSPKEYPSSSDNIYSSAAEKLGSVRAADARLASAFKNIKYIKGQNMPSLILSGGAYTNYSSAATTSTLVGSQDLINGSYVLQNGNKLPVYETQNTYVSNDISYASQWKNNINTAVSVGIQIPIFNKYQVRNRVRQAEADKDIAEYNSKTLRIQLHQAVDRDYMNMRFSFQTFQKLAQQVSEFTTSLNAASIKFENGITTTVDYIIAKNNLDQAKMNYVAAKYDYILRTKILDYYLGNL